MVHRTSATRPASPGFPYRCGFGRRQGLGWGRKICWPARVGRRIWPPCCRRWISSPWAMAGYCGRAQQSHRRRRWPRLAGGGRCRSGLRPAVVSGLVQRTLFRPDGRPCLEKGVGGRRGMLSQITSEPSHRVVDAYRAHLAAWYALESRWPDQPFWARRHAQMPVGRPMPRDRFREVDGADGCS